MKIKIFLASFFILAIFSLKAQENDKYVLWNDYVVFRDAVYNNEKKLDTLLELYDKAVVYANEFFAGEQLFIALSRCENIMGVAYAYANEADNAIRYFDSGMEFAEKAISLNNKNPMSLLMYAENIAQNCVLKPFTFILEYGTKIDNITEKILKLDPENGMAIFLQNAQYIYAPFPFNNYKKGIKNLKSILENKNIFLEKDAFFYVYSGICFGYLKQNNRTEANEWLKQALKIYPNNIFLKSILLEIEKNKA